MIKLILASASPRRSELLKQMGCCFTVVAADIDENRQNGELPYNYVGRLAEHKARSVAGRLHRANTAILAADTIVTQGEDVFGKPRDKQHAIKIWRQLSGEEHQVITAVCLFVDGTQALKVVSSKVEFDVIDEAQMHRYWRTGEPLDKAGGYAIQGLASAWVKLIHGSYSNIVGLPLRETNRLLEKIGHNWL